MEFRLHHIIDHLYNIFLDHEENALCNGYIDESIHDATENYDERGTYDS